MRDQDRIALESTIDNLTRDIHETEKCLAPIQTEVSHLAASLSELRTRNEAIIIENAALTQENQQFQSTLAEADRITTILQSELETSRTTAREILKGLVLPVSERVKREQIIENTVSLFTLRMWAGVWKINTEAGGASDAKKEQRFPNPKTARHRKIAA